MLRVAESYNFTVSFGIKRVAEVVNSDTHDFKGERAGKGKQGRVAKGNFSHIVL